jgi:hypothetical protein
MSDTLAFLVKYGYDLVWYELGRRRGPRVLARICAISLEPDWCVHRTETTFLRPVPGRERPGAVSTPRRAGVERPK